MKWDLRALNVQMRETESLDGISPRKAQNELQRHFPICCVFERKGLLRWGTSAISHCCIIAFMVH